MDDDRATTGTDYTGETRCWPCTIANAAVGLLVAAVPVLAAIVEGSTALLVGALTWAAAVLGFTAYRLVERGYLPYAEPIARATGLHDRIGPGSNSDTDRSKKP